MGMDAVTRVGSDGGGGRSHTALLIPTAAPRRGIETVLRTRGGRSGWIITAAGTKSSDVAVGAAARAHGSAAAADVAHGFAAPKTATRWTNDAAEARIGLSTETRR